MGCRVIGIAGGEEKCAWVRDVARFDEVIDYKAEDVSKRLSELAPQGIDVYFDNVGGPILEAALNHLAMRAHCVVRRHLCVRNGHASAWAAQLHAAHRQARPYGGLPRI